MASVQGNHPRMPTKAYGSSDSLKVREEDRQRFVERHYQQSGTPPPSSPVAGPSQSYQAYGSVPAPYDSYFAGPAAQNYGQYDQYGQYGQATPVGAASHHPQVPYEGNYDGTATNADYKRKVSSSGKGSTPLPPIPTIQTNFAPHIDTELRQPPMRSRSPVSAHEHSPVSPRTDSLPSSASPRVAGSPVFRFPSSPQSPQPQPQVYQPALHSPSPSRNNSLSSETSPVTPRLSPSTSAAFPLPNAQHPEPKGSKSTPNASKPSPRVHAKDKKLSEGDAYCEQAIKYHEAGELEKATNYFRLAAEHDSPTGMFLYGISLRHGWGCNSNPNLAFQYLQKAAENAVVDLNNVNSSASRGELVMAIYELGVSFRHGWGVPKNKTTAAYYYKIAAELGDPDAQNDLAECFVNGHGVKKDMFKAAKYYRMAHAQGRGIVGNSWIFKEKYDKACSTK